MIYALYTYHWRAASIRRGGKGPYDDRLGPVRAFAGTFERCLLTGRCRQFCVSRCSVRGVLPLYPRTDAHMQLRSSPICPTVRRTRVNADNLLLTSSYTSYTYPISLLPFPRPVLSFTAIIFALHPVVVSKAAAYACRFLYERTFPHAAPIACVLA